MQDDVPHGPSAKSAEWEAFIATLVNPLDPTPKQTPDVRSQAYLLPQPRMPSGRVSYDDCKRMDDPPIIKGMKKGDMADARCDDRRFTYLFPNVRGYPEFRKQLGYQDTALKLEGKGRRVFQCLGRQEDVDRLEAELGKNLPSTVKACHLDASPRKLDRMFS